MSYFDFYENFEFKDFIEDEEFRHWVKHPTPAGDRFWKEYCNKYPFQKEIIIEARAFLLGTQTYFDQNSVSETKLNENLANLLAQKKKVKSSEKQRIPFLLRHSKKLGRAAAILFIITAFLGYFLYDPTTYLYKTAYGEWKQVTLPDGSIVDLNANSELKIGKDWSVAATRQVWLKGEAFFEVKKRPATDSKFQVITDDLTIEVLGTAFNVQKRSEQTEVFLKEGSIKLNVGAQEEFMQPGEFLAYSLKDKKVTMRNKVPQETYTSWKNGVLELKATPVKMVLKKIKEIYGVQFEVNNPMLLEKERTIALPMQDLDLVIPILELTLEAEIVKKGNKLIIN